MRKIRITKRNGFFNILCIIVPLVLLFVSVLVPAKKSSEESVLIEEVIIEEVIIEEIIPVVPVYLNVMDRFSDHEKTGEIANLINSLSIYYNIPEVVIYSIIFTESDFVVDAKSSMNCIGLMQVSRWALLEYNRKNNAMYTMEDLRDPIVNIVVGIWYFDWIIKTLDLPSYELAYIAYNVGPTAYRKHGSGRWLTARPVNRFLSKYRIIENIFLEFESSAELAALTN